MLLLMLPYADIVLIAVFIILEFLEALLESVAYRLINPSVHLNIICQLPYAAFLRRVKEGEKERERWQER